MKINPIKLLSLIMATYAALPLIADSASSSNPPQDFPYPLQYELGDTEFAPGDSITIKELRGTSDNICPGGTYCVMGTYTLSSQDEADLSLFTTTTNRTPTTIDPQQALHIKKGSGSFRLIQRMRDDGYLHLTFYSRATGQGFGGVYFGQGKWVLRNKHFRYRDTASQSEKPEVHQPVSTTGPNQVLYEYLGNPVAPPENLDASYTKEGLIRTMQAAARDAGVSLAKLEIDDSEFPFLVGVLVAKGGDMEKLKDQVRTLAAYNYTGGVGGNTSYAMNLIPSSAFPTGTHQRIYRRMMLREVVLSDRINNQ